MIQAWKDLRFSAKLTLIFFLVLSLTIGVITIRQSYSSFRLLEEKSLEDMENLAEQVILNFTQTLEDIENSCYVAMISREVPKNMSGSATYAVQKYTLATMMALVYILTRSVLKKLGEIKKSMKEVANGNFDSRIEVTDADDISQLALAFNDMSQRISELMAELVEKERMRSNAELQVLEYKYRALETQIRPHFIYNALEVISSMAKIKGETEMIDIVQTISRYFRNITQSTTDQFITVQQEFDRLQDYTRIYQFMHGDHLKTVFSARETARNAMIPTMILQPVVENSLKYGLRSQEEDSEIRVHAYTQDGKLLITIRDNGKGLTQEQMEKLEKGETAESSSSGIGMANVRQRLKLIYGDKSSISFRNRTAGGVKVTIEIPFTYSEPDSLWELEQMDDWSDLDELW